MFDVFKRKKGKDILDLRGSHVIDSDIPVPNELRERLGGGRNSNSKNKFSMEPTTPTYNTPNQSITTSSASNQNKSELDNNPESSGGFFGNFFGGNSESKAPEEVSDFSPAISDSIENTQSSVDSSFTPVTDSFSNRKEIDIKLQELNNKISKLIDRIELIERKIDRIEGRRI
jgi:hypothetical protein